MQEEERKGICDGDSIDAGSKQLDDVDVQIQDPSEFNNKSEKLKVETSSIKNEKTLQIETKTEMSPHKRASNVSKKSNQPAQKFGLDTPAEELSAALMSFTMRQGGQSKQVREQAESALKQAQEDASIMKGLVQFLNWQHEQDIKKAGKTQTSTPENKSSKQPQTEASSINASIDGSNF